MDHPWPEGRKPPEQRLLHDVKRVAEVSQSHFNGPKGRRTLRMRCKRAVSSPARTFRPLHLLAARPRAPSSSLPSIAGVLVVVQAERFARVKALFPRRLKSDHISGLHIGRNALQDAEPEAPGITLYQEAVSAMAMRGVVQPSA